MRTDCRDKATHRSIRCRRSIRTRRRQLTAVSIGALLLATLPDQAATAEVTHGNPETLRKMQKLAGYWTSERVEFLDPDGSVRRISAASAHNEFELDGHVLVHRGQLADPPVKTLGWYYVDPAGAQLRMGSVSSGGRYDEFVGGWESGRLVMLTGPKASPGERLFRMTHSDIADNSYVETLEFSEDGGNTWQMANRQTMRRVDPQAVLASLTAYMGEWRSDKKTAQDGSSFHFVYALRWLDPAQTIAHMLITRVESEGAQSVVFEGYKGLDPGGSVYYHAASPSGRGARGMVVLEEGALVTVYEGWSADGNVVDIRDVFGPVVTGTFTSKTFLRAPGDEEWRKVGEDEWSRHAPFR